MNEKVNGVNVPQPSSITALPTPSRDATDRFARALQPVRAGSSGDASRSGPSARNERDRGSDPLERADVDSWIDALDERLRRAHLLGGRFALISEASSPTAQADPADSSAVLRTESKAELAGLIERMCSAMYVGEKSVISQRIVLGLDHVLPGALAEIVREGVHLKVRLNARSEHAYRVMSSQREELQRALEGDGSLRVEVLVQTVHGAMEEDHG